MTERPTRVFTWHVHGSYLYYLAQGDYELWVPKDLERGHGYGGRAGSYAWPESLKEIPAEEVRHADFDLVLYQNERNWRVDGPQILSASQQTGPRLFLEHDPPRAHPTDTRHCVDDAEVGIVHVTHFNRLMWDCGECPTYVVPHGVEVPDKPTYTGEIPRALVIVNDLSTRGRRLGADLVSYAQRMDVPIDIIGMNSLGIDGGIGEVPYDELHEFVGRYRVVFNPIRYTSLGLAVLEAMACGCPVVGLNTTEMAEEIAPWSNGYVSTDIDRVVAVLKLLIADPDEARRLGKAARRHVSQYHGIDEFAERWASVFAQTAEKRTLAAV